MNQQETTMPTESFDVAVIGMACRFPGAKNAEEFWENLKNGVESITFLTDEDLKAAHVLPEMFNDPYYVRAASTIEGYDLFDAKFFGYNPRDAAMLDPQNRLFLEIAWHALESAGYAPNTFDGDIGVFGGAGFPWYLINNLLLGRAGLQNIPDTFLLQVSNDKDNLATRTSYKLNITGPSVTVQTTCSTSLVAVHLAFQSLLNLECDLALAGGVAVKVPPAGYMYQKDMVMSSDGHCRPFDAKASGTVFGSGAGIVVLKRLEDALENRDHILAVIKGSAINNDGAEKVGYTAPAINGQRKVIARALAMADVSHETIGAIENHGTGTLLGDPIEIEALTQVFGSTIKERGACALGSVKSNFGHLETAAGIASFIKMVLCLKHKCLVPSLNFDEPNPHLNLENTPFYVNTKFKPWELNGHGSPRRCGVSSFGVGGTNAHIVLEEAPERETSGPSLRPLQLLTLSAKTTKALKTVRQNLAAALKQDESLNLADVAYTLRFGREAFQCRQTAVCQDREDAVTVLESPGSEKTWTAASIMNDPKIVFMFPGQGSQYVNMGREIYETEPLFKHEVDRCAEILKTHMKLDIRELMYPAKDADLDDIAARLTQTLIAQPAIFVIECALARLWESWGIKPDAMLGHSVGEYTAAYLAGVFSLEDVLYVLAERAKLINGLPQGSMCVVPLPVEEVEPLVPAGLSIALVNGPSLSVVSGPDELIQQFQTMLKEREIAGRLLHTSHAFHSKMMEPMVKPFLVVMQNVSLNPPQSLYFSNESGTYVTEEQATNPQHWVSHTLHTVRFSPAVSELLTQDDVVFLEVGAGTTLNALVKNHDHTAVTIPSLPHPKDERSSLESLLGALGRLWMAGVEPDWQAFQGDEQRNRVVLPPYPFEKARYWIEPVSLEGRPAGQQDLLAGFSVEDAGGGEEEDEDYLAPSTPLEEKIAPIFATTLGFPKLSVHENFFDLGGHSLLATQLLDKINREFDLGIRLREFLKTPTIAGLATLVEQVSAESPEERAKYELPQVVADLEHRYEPFPLTEMQQAQWLGRIGAFALSNVSAHLYFETEAEGLDVERVHKAWQSLIDRHEMLRAVLLPDGGQRILESPPPYHVKNVNLRHEKPEDIDAKLSAIRDEMDHVIRPIEQWPLFEVRTTQLPDDRVRVHFSIDVLICDVTSVRILLRDWALAYENADYSVPESELLFRDYVITYQKVRETKLYEESDKFWDKRVTEIPGMPLLPLIKNPNAIDKPIYNRWNMRLSKERWQRLKARGAERGLSASVIILTAFAELLANWSKTPHFSINTTVINRLPMHPQVEDIIGEFSSFTPLDINIARETTFEELATVTQERAWENLENRYVHGTTILRKLAQYKGGASGAVMPVVFTSIFVQEVEEEEKFAQRFGDLVYLITQTPQVWLDHSVWEDEKGLLLNWCAVSDLFADGLLDTMWATYGKFIDQLVDDENAWKKHHYYEVTPEKELALIREVNDTSVEFEYTHLQTPFFEQASKTPEQIAVIADEKEMTYGELADKANRLGGHLRALDVRPGQLVAVVMDKGWEQIVSVMGILQASGAYLPLDADLPKDRLWYILEEADVKVVLIQQKHEDQIELPEHIRKEVVCDDTLVQLESCELQPVQSLDDLAYVIYTSGSTGYPKGVMISHRGACNTIIDINRRFNVHETDRCFGLSGLNFDLSVYDVFGLLAAGGAIVLPKHDATRDPQHWLDLVTTHKITIWNSVPALMEMFVEFLEGQSIESLPLRLTLLSGDWIPIALPTKLYEKIPGTEVISLGGATEGSIWSIFYPIKEVDPEWVSIPYGKPLANQQMYVLNENLEKCPIWGTGEIYIGGVGVALGYFKNEELTTKSFITHPKTGEYLYRTGDLGRLLPDGNIEFLGREDFQVKISGFRIELEEIEAVLNGHPAVQSCVITAWGKTHERKRLIGYIVGKEGTEADLSEIEEFLKQHLPSYMIPSEFIVMDEFPLTSSGKVDRKALPEPQLAKVTSGDIESKSFLVKKVVAIFAGVLGLEPDKVDIHANFFAMGGDSVMGVQAIARARQEGIEITPDMLFENPTIFDLAKVLEVKYGDLLGEEERFQGRVPLTPVQQRIFEQHGYAASDSNWGMLVKRTESVMPEVLESAFQRLVSQYDVLQLHYREQEEGWIQEYQESAAQVELDFVEVTGMTDEECTTSIADTWKTLEEVQELEESPLVKLCLFHDEEGRNSHLLLVANELILDYRSGKIFFEQLDFIYTKLLQDENAQFMGKGAKCQEWAERIIQQAQSETIWEEKTLYCSLPEQTPPLNLGEAASGSRQKTPIIVSLDEAATQEFFDEALSIAKTNPEELLLTALALTLVKGKRADSLYVDWQVAASFDFLKECGVENSLGNFTWLFPVLLAPNPDMKLEETIKDIKERIRTYHNWGEYYGMLYYLVNDSEGDEDVRKLPRPHVKFTYTELPVFQEASFEWIKMAKSRNWQTKQGAYVFEIDVVRMNGTLNVLLNFNPLHGAYEVVEQIGHDFLREIRELMAYLKTCDAAILSPTDFGEAGLDQDELAKFLVAFAQQE